MRRVLATLAILFAAGTASAHGPTPQKVDQTITIAIYVVTFHAPALHLEIKRAGATYDGTLSDDGSIESGFCSSPPLWTLRTRR